MHVKLQLDPLQAGTPPIGVLHEAHVPPQFNVPAGHWQPPASQNPPPLEQAWPQLPQFWLSTPVSTQVLVAVQRSGKALLPHTATQLAPLQVVDPFVGAAGQDTHEFAQFIELGGQLLHVPWLHPLGQVLPQPPQFLGSLAELTSHPFAGLPSQSRNTPMHEATLHTERTHVSIALFLLHAVPQPPQLLGSIPTFTQAALVPFAHSVGAKRLLQEAPHAVPSQVATPFVGVGHRTHDVVPHELIDVLLEQVVPQRCVPAGQAHWDSSQDIPPVHAIAHPPQLFGSLVVSAHKALAPLPQSV